MRHATVQPTTPPPTTATRGADRRLVMTVHPCAVAGQWRGRSAALVDRDGDGAEPGGDALSPDPFGPRDRHAELGDVGVLERERVEQAEQAVADRHRAEAVGQLLTPAEGRVRPGVAGAADSERHTDVVDPREAPTVEDEVGTSPAA